MKRKAQLHRAIFIAFTSIVFVIACISLTSCLILPNFDSEWTYPEIKGYISDSLTNKPIGNVEVSDDYLGYTVFSDTTGFFNLKAKKEYIKFHVIAMDPPKPYIYLKFEKDGYQTKELTLKHRMIVLTRKYCDTLDIKNIKLIYNVP